MTVDVVLVFCIRGVVIRDANGSVRGMSRSRVGLFVAWGSLRARESEVMQQIPLLSLRGCRRHVANAEKLQVKG
jgi:hypothetical protein